VIEVEFNDADRRAFQYYALEQRGARQTASELGVSLDQVYQAKSRIVKRLSALIDLQRREEG
jgi:DNA-directed RNA polymerase specialized sigma24 family protein